MIEIKKNELAGKPKTITIEDKTIGIQPAGRGQESEAQADAPWSCYKIVKYFAGHPSSVGRAADS